MRREQLTEKILDIKRKHGWRWRHIAEEIGGVSPILVVGALLGQMKLVKPLARKAAQLFDLSEEEERMLNEVPNRGTPMPPTDPLLYRFYELVMVNGPAIKALIEEGLRKVIDERRHRGSFKLRKVTFKGNGLQAELAGASWDKIREKIYEGRGA